MELSGCQVRDNNGDGLHVSGVGSRVVAQQCYMARNKGQSVAMKKAYDVRVTGHGWAELTACTVGTNISVGYYHLDPGSSSRLVLDKFKWMIPA